MLSVRMAVLTGEVELSQGDYRGLALNEASRMLAAGHGGQVLCSEVTARLVRDRVGEGIELVDLGVYRLRDIDQPRRIFQVSFPAMREEPFPALRAEPGHIVSLPTVVTNFIGREDEIEHLHTLLMEPGCQLVTLTGPGGSGKTRLAIETARRLTDDFRGAVWFVALEQIIDAALIDGAVADAMQLPRSGHADPLAQAAEVLARQPALVVLDNAEHVVGGVAAAVRTLISKVPDLKLIVTSRRRLNLQAEREFVVPPLALPEPDLSTVAVAECPSVQLFVDRAQAVRADSQITDANAADIAELCRHLEGMPLALELAAAHVNVLTPSQMVAQLADRFAFLVGRRRDASARHRTLRATIEWSYRLLPPELQTVLAQLSVLRADWDVSAAQAVCERGDIRAALEDLQEHSLFRSAEAAGVMRFHMLESIREFADGELSAAERTRLRVRHAAFFLGLAEDCARRADEGRETEAFDALATDLANIRAAMDHADAAGGAGEPGMACTTPRSNR